MPEQWKLLLLMQYADPETVLRMAEEHRNAKAHEEFELWAIDCPHLVLEDYGNATEHICRHPDRDNLSTWVMCDREQCPAFTSGERLVIKDVRRFGIEVDG